MRLKHLFLFLAAIIVLPITAFAQSDGNVFTFDNTCLALDYYYDDDNEITYACVKKAPDPSVTATEWIIPSEFNGYPVILIKENLFANKQNLVKITLPKSLKILSAKSDVGSGNGKSINPATKLEETSPYFFGQSANGEIDLGEGSVNFSGTFYNCHNLEEVVFEDGCPELESLGGGLFFGCYKLRKVELPSHLTEIPGFTFAYCHELSELTIPSSVTKIGRLAFLRSHIPSTENMTLQDYIKYFPTRDYNYGSATRTGQNINQTYESLCNSYGYTDSPSLHELYSRIYKLQTSYDFPTVDDFAKFNGKGVSAVPASVTSIDPCAFYETMEMPETYTIPTTLTDIGMYAFYGNGAQRLKAQGHTKFNIAKNAIRDDVKVSMLVPADEMDVYATEDNLRFATIAAEQSREVTADNFGTLCLAYDAVKPTTGVEIYTVVDATYDDSNKLKSVTIDLHPEEVDVLTAGVPYFLKATDDAIIDFEAVDKFNCVTEGTDANGLHGVLTVTDVATGVYMLKDNMLHRAAEGSQCGANRAYLVPDEIKAPAAANLSPKAKRLVVDDTTGIVTIENATDPAGIIYDLQGRRVDASNAQKGIYIVDGKKVLIK